VVGVARSADLLNELRDQLGDRFTPEIANATDPSLPERLIAEYRPRTLVLNAGATPSVRSLIEQTWDSSARTGTSTSSRSSTSPARPWTLRWSLDSGS
jgi:NADP-dependent 3-hydroxy acid dehydrogenase YdfG